jgi:two-component system chemotaxis response regulator CheB
LTKRIKVLIVDDSLFLRSVLTSLLEDDPEIIVCGTAVNGADALEKAALLAPDVITLDVEMPVEDGISALRRIMERDPLPVIMLSSRTRQGERVTLQALELGAFDFVTKPAGAPFANVETIGAELRAKIKAAAKCPIERLGRSVRAAWPAAPAPAVPAGGEAARVVAVGCSTGGPQALYRIIPALPAELPAAVLIAQHMPPGFTATLAERLNFLSRLTVKEAEPEEKVTAGTVYIAPGASHLEIAPGKNRPGWFIRLSREERGFLYRPSADCLLTSVARVCRTKAVGVILTGMGADGAKGIIAVKEAGGRTIAQDEASCVVYGMPKMAVQTGRVDRVAPLAAIATEIELAVRRSRSAGKEHSHAEQ